MQSALFFKHHRDKYSYRHWLWAIAIPLIITLIDWPFREVLTPSNILMFYLLGVFFVAIRFGFWPSILASLTNAAAFAYFFAPPIFSLAIVEQENLVGLAVTMVIGAVTSNLAENIRQQAYEAEQRERRASALYSLSKELAEARQEKDIIEIGSRHIQTEFGGYNLFLFPDTKGKLCCPNGISLDSCLKERIVLDVAFWVFNHGQIAGNGTENRATEPLTYVPLNGSTGSIGVLVLGSVDLYQSFHREQNQLFDTYLNQIIHALERASSAEQAKSVTLKMQAETLRNSLLSSISHDLRNPLATIIGAASTLEINDARLDADSKRKLVTVISEEAQLMSDLTIKILDMARLEAGNVVLNKQWYAPEEIIGSALRRLDQKLKSRKINILMADNLALIHIDAVLFQQVMVNLLENADKYSPAGLAIDISVEITELGLSIAVADRGPGIHESLQQKVFDKFFRVHEESAQSGVGLGLSICRAIIDAHAGKIQLTNRSGGGTLVQLYLPLLEYPPTIDPEEKL
jgi:two-component system sensor histidine kinase KdpD